MTTLLSQQAIQASLLSFWNEVFTEPVVTVFPGMKINTAAQTEWFEVWIDSWSRKPQRIGGVPLLDVTTTVHVFVKGGTESGRVHALTDRVRELLSQQTVTLRDWEQSGTPVVGHLRLREPETRNLTRHHGKELQVILHHTAVVIRGVAQGG